MLNELIKKIETVLDKDVWVESVYQYEDLPVIAVDVRGDWKHDHLRCDWLIEENVSEVTKFNTKVTEEDGSDYYSATHYYIVKL